MKTPSILLTACFFFLFPGQLSAAEYSSTKSEGVGAVFDGLFDEEPSRYAKRSWRADDKDFDVDVDEKSPAPYFVADSSSVTHKGATYPLKEFPRIQTDPKLKEFWSRWSVSDNERKQEKNTHKGATYPATKTYQPDCSEFIDPKDAAKFSHCAGPVQPSNDKWHGFLELMGKPGTVRSLGQADLFFPLAQDENDLTFFDLRGQMDDFDNSEYNIGFGHRHMFDENSDSLLRGWIIGGYGFFDHRFNDSGNKFKQATFGLELKSEVWDFRANGYIPESTTRTVTTGSNVQIIRPGDQIRAQISGVLEEKALAGYDLEVGYKLPISDKFLPERLQDLDLFEDTRLYLSGYHFIGEGNFETVAGPRLRLETRIHDVPALGNGSRLLLGVETQYDDPRGSQTFGLVSLRIPFGVGNTSKTRRLKGLDRRMMDPVVRDVDVVAPQNDVPVELAPVLNENGEEITRVVDVEMADCAGEADPDACMQTAVSSMMSGMVNNGEVGLVFVHGMGEGTTLMQWDTDMTVMPDQITASAGMDMSFAFQSATLGAGETGYTEDGTPVGTNGDGCWNLADGAQLSGWTVDGSGCASGSGVTMAANGGKAYMTNSIVRNAKSENVKLSAGTLYVDGLTLYGSDTGMLIEGTGKLRGVEGTNGTIGYTEGITDENTTRTAVIQLGNVTDTVGTDTIDQLEESQAQVAGVTVDATNYSTGILANSAGQYFVTNTVAKNASQFGSFGQGRGIQVNGSGGTLYVTDSKVENNSQDGFRVTGGATMELDNVEVINNGRSEQSGGIFVGDNGSSLVMTNSTVYDNYIGLKTNGGPGNLGGQITVSGSKFYNNNLFGIEIWPANSESSISDTEVYSNGNAGIVVYGTENGLNITDTISRDNGGAGLIVDSDPAWSDPQAIVTATGLTITGNGGNAVVAKGDSIVTITDSTLNGNCREVNRSGIPGTITVDGNDFDFNPAAPCP